MKTFWFQFSKSFLLCMLKMCVQERWLLGSTHTHTHTHTHTPAHQHSKFHQLNISLITIQQTHHTIQFLSVLSRHTVPFWQNYTDAVICHHTLSLRPPYNWLLFLNRVISSSWACWSFWPKKYPETGRASHSIWTKYWGFIMTRGILTGLQKK